MPHYAEFSTAARAWFTLRWAGFRDVRVLDGQLPAWADAGGSLGDAAPPHREASAPTLSGGMLPTLDADDAAAIAQNGSLLDARPFSAYAGQDGDPGTGHIPGAVSARSTELVTDGHLRPSADIRKWFLRHRAIGQPAGAYCGGGVGSTTIAFAAATIGETLPLYIASWSGWSANPDAAVEQGSGQSQLVHTDC
ncbi:sulfurtransferase [Microbacterium saperdae]